MSETFFPISDLLRRKLQTGLVIVGLALCVASTFFLLLLGDRIGFGIFSIAENRLTVSFSAVFSRFILFVGLLTFVVGVVIISFMVFVMMSQRIRDIGLMKAAGCPNDLIFGYFMNELVIVAFVGCFLGVALGILADYASASFLSSIGFQVAQESINLWLALAMFILFFILSLIIGAKPVLDTTKVEPIKALSPSFSIGLSKESDFEGISKAGITLKLAIRSLFRRKSASVRVILCLTTVFILLTVAVAGGIVADQTTRKWVEKAVGKNVVLIAHHDMSSQYKSLLSKFYEAKDSIQLNYSDERYQISEELMNQLGSIQGLSIDMRLVIEAQIEEVQGIILGEQTGTTTYVGDSRKGKSLIVGVEPGKVLSDWFIEGQFLRDDQASDAVIGDTIAQTMFSSPLDQNVSLFEKDFRIIGVCLDPINNGRVTYVPLKSLQRITGISKPNFIIAKIDASADRSVVMNQINTAVKSANSEFEVVELNEILDRELGFLGYIWSTIMFLPMLSLTAAALCIISYVVLTINEQRQEFGILRAVGAKPRAIVKIVFAQNLLVSLSSCATGIALGTMVTLLILIPQPFVTSLTIVEIAAWLLTALFAILACSMYPAVRFARKPILETMT